MLLQIISLLICAMACEVAGIVPVSLMKELRYRESESFAQAAELNFFLFLFYFLNVSF